VPTVTQVGCAAIIGNFPILCSTALGIIATAEVDSPSRSLAHLYIKLKCC
jgi:hypothetical protein